MKRRREGFGSETDGGKELGVKWRREGGRGVKRMEGRGRG